MGEISSLKLVLVSTCATAFRTGWRVLRDIGCMRRNKKNQSSIFIDPHDEVNIWIKPEAMYGILHELNYQNKEI